MLSVTICDVYAGQWPPRQARTAQNAAKEALEKLGFINNDIAEESDDDYYIES